MLVGIIILLVAAEVLVGIYLILVAVVVAEVKMGILLIAVAAAALVVITAVVTLITHY